MAGDVPSIQSLNEPIKAKEILAQERRQYDDCLSCRIVGEFCIWSLVPYLHSHFRYLLLMKAEFRRWHGISCPWWLQLLGGHEAARAQPRQDHQEQVIHRHARPKSWPSWDLAWSGVVGHISHVWMIKEECRIIGRSLLDTRIRIGEAGLRSQACCTGTGSYHSTLMYDPLRKSLNFSKEG